MTKFVIVPYFFCKNHYVMTYYDMNIKFIKFARVTFIPINLKFNFNL